MEKFLKVLNSKKFIKGLSGTMAFILAVSAVVLVWKNTTIEVEAKGDTLPGIAALRDQFLDSETPYKILELVPNLEDASLGYYFGGEEPFQAIYDDESRSNYNLYDQTTSTFGSWRDKLQDFEEKEDRVDFMEELTEAAEIQLEYFGEGNGAAPYHVEQYRELDKPSENGDSYTLTYGEVVRRGYLEYVDNHGAESADWWVVFEDIGIYSDEDVEYINTNLVTPFYRVKEYSEPVDVEALASDEATAGIPLYRETYDDDALDTYFRYEGTAAEVWEKILNSVSGNTVSGGNNGSVSGGDAVSGSDAVSGGDEEETTTPPTYVPTVSGNDYLGVPFYEVVFELINDGDDQTEGITYGEHVYSVKEGTEYTRYVEYGGNYRLIDTLEGVLPGSTFIEPAKTVYYTGGIVSNEVFKHKVLSINSTANFARLNVEIYVMTPDMLYDMLHNKNATFVRDMDMICIGGGASEFTTDLDQTSKRELSEQIYNSKKPCVFDLSDFYDFNENNEYVATKNLPYFYELLADLMEKAQGIAAGDFEGIDTDRDMQFVKRSVWFFDGNDGTPFVRRGELSEKEHTQIVDGKKTIVSDLAPVYDEIVLENKYREADASFTGNPLETDVYDWTIWRYIINYVNNKTTVQKNNISVLEIQPATDVSELNETTVLHWLGYKDTDIDTNNDKVKDLPINVTIKTMAMNEFVGVIADMNATYDIIYIGSSAGNLHTDNGATVYNNTIMNGLVYSHIGDTVNVSPNFSGLLDTDFTGNDRESDTVREYTSHRYSGNDLTIEKYNVLLDYLDATYPIVVDDALMEKGTNGAWQVNGDMIDNSSYLYEFIDKAFGNTERTSIFCETDLSTEAEKSECTEFEFYVNRPKLWLEADEDYPDLIIVPDVGGEYNDHVTQISPDNNDHKYYLQYTFTIRNDGAVAYDEEYVCKLYLDSNADGKFSEVNEELTGLRIEDSRGNNVSADNLRLGEQYTVTRQVPENYYGCITWQLSVSQKKNQSIRTTHKGYTKLNSGNELGTVIKILQIYFEETNYTETAKITRDPDWTDEQFFNVVNAEDNRDPKVINLQTSIGKFDPVAKTYGKKYGDNYKVVDYRDLNKDGDVLDAGESVEMDPTTEYFLRKAQGIYEDYILDITAISSSRFELNEEDIDLNSYDMLILGFSDAKLGADFKNATVIGDNNSIQSFIASGKSVLFAHDMTSFLNIEVNYDKNIDKSQQDYLTYQTRNNDGNTVVRPFLYKPEGSHYDTYWGFQMNKYLRTMVGLDTYGITSGNLYPENNPYTDLQYGRDNLTPDAIPEPELKTDGTYEYNVYDVAYRPKSARENLVPQVQGFTAYLLNQRMTAVAGQQQPYRAEMGTGGSSDSTHIKKVNDGQITNFPYIIDDYLETAPTHMQYYTLDLNADSDEDEMTDTVVWYNLAGGNFDRAPGDVKNNYYIYNKGNVTYTGMGHAVQNNGKWNHVSENEAELFINTMVAAYNTGIRPPKVMTYNANGLETDSIVNYYDSLFDNEVAADNTVDMYFEVEDLNIGHGSKDIQAQFFVEDAGIQTSDAVPAAVQTDGAKVRNISGQLMVYDENGVLIAKPAVTNANGDVDYSTLKLDGDGNVIGQTINGEEVLDLRSGVSYILTKIEVQGQATRYKITGITGLQPGVTYTAKVPVSYLSRKATGSFDSRFYIAARTLMTKRTVGNEIVLDTAWASGSMNYVNVDLFNLD